MALALCLLPDRQGERAIRGLWDRLEGHGLPTLRSHTHGHHVPHLSYAVLRRWDLDLVQEALTTLADAEPLEVTFDGVGLFRRGRGWLVPGATTELTGRQDRALTALLATGADVHEHYRRGRWTPHCTVAPRVPLHDLPRFAATLYDVLPMDVRFDTAAWVDSSTGHRWPLARLP